uniref:TNFR-Cys domain-containing protein n=1 Tax=Nothobranchius furzeri TaxID=105023 RepID=A0A8C6PJD2_NOTFU
RILLAHDGRWRLEQTAVDAGGDRRSSESLLFRPDLFSLLFQGHFWHFLPSLLPIALLSAVLNVVYPLTFTHRDPFTGRSLQCDRCPPGTFLRARCSTAKSSECAPCPQGSFTELWNYVGRCLRCGVCGRNQVVKKECTAKSDCQCECKRGYYYSHDVDMCVRHSECPSGSGVLTPGTPENDTVCHICSNGTFSDVSSAHERCKQHKNCSGAGQLLLLQGSSWHDRLCGSCGELTSKSSGLKGCRNKEKSSESLK